MHNNYYLLRKLSAELDATLKGSVISECFSQNKDELVVRFETHAAPFFIRASLVPEFSCLSFPGEYARARRNSVDLFPELIGQRVEGIRQFENERSFALLLSNEHGLLFKMHGNRSNIMVYKGLNPLALFRTQLASDLQLTPDSLDKHIDWSRTAFDQHIDLLKNLYFTFGKVIWSYLSVNGFEAQSPDEKWNAIQSLRRELNEPEFRITELKSKLVLSLVPVGNIHSTYATAVLALNTFFTLYSTHSQLYLEKQRACSQLNTQLRNTEAYLVKARQKLAMIESDNPYRHWADLIMANLHRIETGSEQITLPDFERDGRPVEIRLKKDLSAQKNAEVYYRKHRNHHIEVGKLREGITRKEDQVNSIRHQLEQVAQAANLSALRKLVTATGIDKEKSQAQVSMPYRVIEYKGYQIWIGKSARDNDVLTLKHAYKEDLWLHAKDVAGSHVIIKHQAGRKFPKDVIERAAQLAAYHSRRKNESLCPVAYTPRKFVRKRKGDRPGAMVLERETVILVAPQQ